MPVSSKKAFRLFKGIAEGTIKKKGITPSKAKEMVSKGIKRKKKRSYK